VLGVGPLWGFSSLAELASVGGSGSLAPEGPLQLIQLVTRPRPLAFLLASGWILAVWEDRRFAPLVSAALLTFAARDVAAALFPWTAFSTRTLLPGLVLLLPAVAHLLVRSLGARTAVASAFAVVAVSVVGAAESGVAGAFSGKLAATYGLVAVGLVLAIFTRREYVVAGCVVAALALETLLSLDRAASLHRPAAEGILAMRLEAGTCPLAIVMRSKPNQTTLGRLNRLMNGACAGSTRIYDVADAAELDFDVAFSRIEKIPGTRRVQVSEVRRIWRFDRLPEAASDDAS
jgi:hypothetical protein